MMAIAREKISSQGSPAVHSKGGWWFSLSKQGSFSLKMGILLILNLILEMSGKTECT